MPQYRPYSGSFASRVIEFLTNNPEEELTDSDAAIKFSKDATLVRALLALAIKSGVIVRVLNERNQRVYRLGATHPNSAS